jgi:hypothetical protein
MTLPGARKRFMGDPGTQFSIPPSANHPPESTILYVHWSSDRVAHAGRRRSLGARRGATRRRERNPWASRRDSPRQRSLLSQSQSTGLALPEMLSWWLRRSAGPPAVPVGRLVSRAASAATLTLVNGGKLLANSGLIPSFAKSVLLDDRKECSRS